MKNLGRNPLASFGSVLLAALWLFAAGAQAASPGAAQVKKVVGTVTYTDAKGGGPLTEGQILFQGATITTGAGSYADLFLGVNGDSLRVEADSTIALNKLEYTKAAEVVVNTELEVKKGATVANVVNKLSKASKYEIKTPAGVAGIRGTVLRAGTTRIVCLIGKVEFRPIAGGGMQLVIGGTAVTLGGGVIKAASVETAGLARSATSLTANTVANANMVANVVQQFTAALAAEAATEAGKAGGNSTTTAAQAAKAIMAELVQAVQEAAAQAPPAIRAAAQAAAANLVKTSEAVQATAAASAAASATVANGGTAQQARAAAQGAANQSTSNQAVANTAANKVTSSTINNAIQTRNQGGGTAAIIESVAENTRPAGPGPGPGPGPKAGTKTGVDTKVGETVIFVSPDTSGTQPKQ
ncbi:MAG: FecR domain-containing protein [Limisphaerales bacterium]